MKMILLDSLLLHFSIVGADGGEIERSGSKAIE
jgi:hypothetical protein